MTRKVPSYRLHKTSGSAVCTINGKDHYLGPFGSGESKAAYRRLIQEWEATGKSSSYGASKPSVTLAMLMVDYLEHCEKHYPQNANSETKQTQIALRYLADYQDCQATEFGPLRLKAVDRQHIVRILSATCSPKTKLYATALSEGKVIYLYREDREAQLRSWQKACQTGIWYDGQVVPHRVAFLAGAADTIDLAKSCFERRAAMTISYENLVFTWQSTIAAILELVGWEHMELGMAREKQI